MPARRVIRWARVEYQPNLQQPVTPVPLGVVVEELRSGDRNVIIIGREPSVTTQGLQLEDAWGPFREIVTGWVAMLAKSARESVDRAKQGAATKYAIDDLAQRWKFNVYLREPESKAVSAERVTLETYARRLCKTYLDDPKPTAPSRRRTSKAKKRLAKSSQARSWVKRWDELLAAA